MQGFSTSGGARGHHPCITTSRIEHRWAYSLLAGASLARQGAFSVHEGIGFLSIIVLMLWLLWLLATSIALVVRGQRV